MSPRHVVQGHEAIYRRLILHLVKAVLEIPWDVRERWWREIAAKSRERRTSEEQLVSMILCVLPTPETLAQFMAEREDPHKVRRLQLVDDKTVGAVRGSTGEIHQLKRTGMDGKERPATGKNNGDSTRQVE